MAQHAELLTHAANEAWVVFLTQFASLYDRFRGVVQKLAQLDVLFSLAVVAGQPGYVRPTVVVTDNQEAHIDIVDGRHPMVDMAMPGEYVANDTMLHGNGIRCMIVTGPNMGGKSSYMRQVFFLLFLVLLDFFFQFFFLQVALLCLMAQIGSFVPAGSMSFQPLDGIFTRMGASDNIYKRQSTFMVELQEAADVLRQASPHSLVIMDELGRGTSTHDGVAIAYATLRHLALQTRCLTLFVTHYLLLSRLAIANPTIIRDYHMSFAQVRYPCGLSDQIVSDVCAC
jgi:DNA mismatch repair protein MSH3